MSDKIGGSWEAAHCRSHFVAVSIAALPPARWEGGGVPPLTHLHFWSIRQFAPQVQPIELQLTNVVFRACAMNSTRLMLCFTEDCHLVSGRWTIPTSTPGSHPPRLVDSMGPMDVDLGSCRKEDVKREIRKIKPKKHWNQGNRSMSLERLFSVK